MTDKQYEFLDELTYADIAFKAYGKTVEELFTNAALATAESMASLDSIAKDINMVITIEERTIEKALHAFLEEIIFLKDSNSILYSDYRVSILKQDKEKITLRVHLKGQRITDSMELHNDIKAITMHEFYVKKTKKGWEAQVVLDV